MDCPCGVDFLRTLRFSICRSQKPLMLKAMKFSALALPTFSRVSLIPLFLLWFDWFWKMKWILLITIPDFEHIFIIFYCTTNVSRTSRIASLFWKKNPILDMYRILNFSFLDLYRRLKYQFTIVVEGSSLNTFRINCGFSFYDAWQ